MHNTKGEKKTCSKMRCTLGQLYVARPKPVSYGNFPDSPRGAQLKICRELLLV